MSEVITTKKAAQFLGVHVETIRRLARTGSIPSFKVGKDWRFRMSDLQAWIDKNQTDFRKGRVLVVDDEENILRMLERLLTVSGYEVTTTVNGFEAINLIARQRPDVVLLDLDMPVLNGPDTLKKIQEFDAPPPVIIITGYPDSDLMMQAINLGPVLVLPKPVGTKQLISAIELARKGAQAEMKNV